MTVMEEEKEMETSVAILALMEVKVATSTKILSAEAMIVMVGTVVTVVANVTTAVEEMETAIAAAEVEVMTVLHLGMMHNTETETTETETMAHTPHHDMTDIVHVHLVAIVHVHQEEMEWHRSRAVHKATDIQYNLQHPNQHKNQKQTAHQHLPAKTPNHPRHPLRHKMAMLCR